MACVYLFVGWLFCFDLICGKLEIGKERQRKEIKLNGGGENLGELGEKMFSCTWKTL